MKKYPSLNIVVFSYNRAMQVDATLTSIKTYLTGVDYSINVLYHYAPYHKDSYDKLINHWQSDTSVEFHLRKLGRSFWTSVVPTFFKYWRNLYWFFKYSNIRSNEYAFKSQLEQIIKSTDASFTMINPDDTIFYSKASIPESILDHIEASPNFVTYRMYVGNNQSDSPSQLKLIDGLLSWDYYDSSMYRHWSMPFAGDGTIYSTKGVLQLFGSVLYNSPSTLEGNCNTRCKQLGMFSKGYSPIVSQMVNLPVNKVQTVNDNKCGNLDVETLCDYYMQGYRMTYVLPNPVTESALIPEAVELKNSNSTIRIEIE